MTPPSAAPTSRPALYALEDVSVRYGRTQAVSDLSLAIHDAEVVALLGDNGAGKSTVIKLMSGLLQPSQGRVCVDGIATTITDRRASERVGIETIYQDTALVDSLSITRNIFMGREMTNRLGLMKHRAMRAVALDVLRNAVQISGIGEPERLVGELSGGQKQAVAIARAVWFKRRILLLDEPTSALSVRETEKLLAYIEQLRDEGVSSVLVTHNLHHAFQVCDRFVVLSHGRKILDVAKADTSVQALTECVVLN